MNIVDVIEERQILPYLQSRKLLTQYQKAKRYILLGYLSQVDFKLRKPKENEIYSFRINKQFRAFCIYKENRLRVIEISNYQN